MLATNPGNSFFLTPGTLSAIVNSDRVINVQVYRASSGNTTCTYTELATEQMTLSRANLTSDLALSSDPIDAQYASFTLEAIAVYCRPQYAGEYANPIIKKL